MNKEVTFLYRKDYKDKRSGRKFSAGSTVLMPEDEAWESVRLGRGIIVERGKVPRRDKLFRAEGMRVR